MNTTPSESCEEFGWKHAMILVGEGVEIQMKGEWKWLDLPSVGSVNFAEDLIYRRKPVLEKKEESNKPSVSLERFDQLEARVSMLQHGLNNVISQNEKIERILDKKGIYL